jgi:hypothetical protein
MVIQAKKLPLVPRELQLSGQTSPEIERFIRSVARGSTRHDGVMRTFSTLARHTAERIVPPSIVPELLRPLSCLLSSPTQTGPTTLASHAKALGDITAELEMRTIAAVLAAGGLEVGPSPTGADESTWLDLCRHSETVLRRYVSLSVFLAAESVLGVLEAVQDPTRLLDVVPNLAASRAYQKVALGSLRHRPFRERAFQQATWDSARPTSRALGQDARVLAPQILHEFLGARFRAHAQTEQAEIEAFLAFSFEPAHPDSKNKSN